MLDPEAIIAKLNQLRLHDTAFKVFGAGAHRYRLHPCISEAEVLAVENRYGITLPPDYRVFLLHVGDGGAGPSYGLFRLGQHDDGHGFCPWERGYLLGDPSQPFRHTEPWNLPQSFWDQEPDFDSMPQREADLAYERWDAIVERDYWNTSIMNGAIPVCHLGCAYRQWLVVTGPEAGNIWNDDRVDNRGIYPLVSTAKQRVSFAGWYEQWLDESLGPYVQL